MRFQLAGSGSALWGARSCLQTVVAQAQEPEWKHEEASEGPGCPHATGQSWHMVESQVQRQGAFSFGGREWECEVTCERV